MLGRSNLVMFCLGKNTKLPQLAVQILHEFLNARFNHTKVVIFEFLTLRSLCTKEGTACINQIFSFVVNALVYKEVFLFRTNSCFYAGNCFVALKKLEYTNSLLADCLHRAEQRSLFIQSFTCIRTEGSWNTKSSVLNKSITGWIPGSITAGFKSCTNTATRET